MIPLLKTVPYLAGLRADVLRTIAASSRSKSFRAGQVVFTEGDPCQHLHVLESGRVKFYRTSPEGREQIMRVFDRQGDTFCIPSAFRAGTYIVSARASRVGLYVSANGHTKTVVCPQCVRTPAETAG